VRVGEHAFLPHFRTEAVRKLVTAVGISTTPIRWEKDPHRSARIVIARMAGLSPGTSPPPVRIAIVPFPMEARRYTGWRRALAVRRDHAVVISARQI